MTGCYPKRIDMAYGSDFAVLLAADKKGLNPEELTIAEVLKSAGYEPACSANGTWVTSRIFCRRDRASMSTLVSPTATTSIRFIPGRAISSSLPCRCWKVRKLIEMDPDADYLTKRLTERAVKFIEKNKE